jgi:sugar-phosphatase
MELVADAVLFDSDGVLVDSHEQVEIAWRELAARYDLDTERLLVELIGVRAGDTLARHLPPDKVDEAVSRLEDLEVISAVDTPSIPGARELLAALPLGKWAIVTSASRRLGQARWRGAGLSLPSTVITAEDVNRGKPDPEPFLTGADRLGVDPTACVVFEDSPAGGTAARDAGARVVAVGSQPWPFEPDARIPNLEGVLPSITDDHRLRLVFGAEATAGVGPRT